VNDKNGNEAEVSNAPVSFKHFEEEDTTLLKSMPRRVSVDCNTKKIAKNNRKPIQLYLN
jgi:hypothetical protein